MGGYEAGNHRENNGKNIVAKYQESDGNASVIGRAGDESIKNTGRKSCAISCKVIEKIIEGYVKNGRMIIDENSSAYEGRDFIITFLQAKPQETRSVGKTVDLSAYGERTEWGQHVEEYMEAVRGFTGTGQ